MGSISEQKKLLRNQLISRRGLIPQDYWLKNSNLIKDNILKCDIVKQAKTIHCFVSMNDRKEVNTHSLISELITQEKEIVVPITSFEDGTLNHSRIRTLNDLKPNKWGVLEPQNTLLVNKKDIDLVLVPLLAADITGNRIGYGKGFYDRFLSTFEKTKIGLVFDDFILKKIPTDTFDIKLDALISQSGIKYM